VIVADASAVIEALLGTAAGLRAASRLLAGGEDLHAPHLLEVEVLHALRGLERRGELAEGRAELALVDFRELRISLHGHGPLLGRAWELRGAMTAYDAMYVALAEVLDAPLVTADARLARAHGHRARIERP
jgi:predicted nucleic acid-binding protein